MHRNEGSLEVELTGVDRVDARWFRVEEGLSELFAVHLEVVCAEADVDLDQVVGRPARFSLRAGDLGPVLRTWAGICRSIQQVDVEPTPQGLSTYAVVIVPRLWLLSQRRNHRVFQQRSEPQAALAVLDEWDLEVDVRVDLPSYPTREYRVQYAESDFAFVSRMLEDAGITFFFEDDRLVLSDAPHRRELEKRLPFVHTPVVSDNELATRVRIERRVRPGRYTQRDIDHRRPPEFQVLATEHGGLDPEARLERFHYTPGAFLFQQAAEAATPVADDRGTHRADLTRGSEQVRRRLDAKRGSARTVHMEVRASDLAPGRVMALLDHPRRDLGPDRALLVRRMVHEGAAVEDWRHEVEARFTDIPFRPPLRTPKPRAHGIESATVVGPRGEEIHVDEMGRIRVHFHWDRESQMDEHSSCWVPVSHPWGGAGYGAINLPRIGQEVIVNFLGGDPDRPVVVGRLFTGVQQVPYQLPAHKTQSGLKSFSSPSTGGYNELMFEDAAGQELVRIQAERDLDSLVKNDERSVIHNDRTRQIGRDDDLHVKRHQNLVVDGSRFSYVDGREVRTTYGPLLNETIAGPMVHSSYEPIIIESEKQILLRVGNSELELLPYLAVLKGDRVYINPPEQSPRLEAIQRNLIRLFGSP